MKCPIDNVDLVMSDRQGIEIDYCPTCRGVWLDRGELDKIIERSLPAEPPRAPEPRRDERRPEQTYEGRDYRDNDYRHKPKKRESFLGDIFDF
jgi:Zn-finger nucleic acid-binding protein